MQRAFRFSVLSLLTIVAVVAMLMAILRSVATDVEQTWLREQTAMTSLPRSHNFPTKARIRPLYYPLLRLYIDDRNFERVIAYAPVSLDLRDTDFRRLRDLTALRTLYIGDNPVTDDIIQSIASLKDLEELDLSRTLVSDPGMEILAAGKCVHLHTLWINSTDVTSHGLSSVARLKSLEVLIADDTDVDDSGIEYLSSARRLRILTLSYTKISDRSLSTFSQFPNLESVDLRRTAITRRAVAAFSRAHPGIEIICDD
jgi:hypothetical protein